MDILDPHKEVERSDRYAEVNHIVWKRRAHEGDLHDSQELPQCKRTWVIFESKLKIKEFSN